MSELSGHLRALNPKPGQHPVWSLQIFVPGKDRQTISMGRIPERAAQRLHEHIDAIIKAKDANQEPAAKHSLWLLEIAENKPRLHARLVELGLAKAPEPAQKVEAVREPAKCPTVEQWVTKFIEQRRNKKKPRTIELYEQTKKALVRQLGSTTPIDQVTGAHAAEWDAYLAARTKKDGTTISPETRKGFNRHAKCIFQEAVNQELITRNPFRKLETAPGKSNKKGEYISEVDALRVMDQIPYARIRLLFAFARFAGTRRNEPMDLNWDDIDFERGTITITAAEKTGDSRVIPIAPELEPLLVQAQAAAEVGEARVLPLSKKTNAADHIIKAIKAAGLKRWPNLFQSLRKSRERDWRDLHPADVVNEWIGHSEEVASRHYLSAMQHHIEAVTKRAAVTIPVAPSVAPHGPEPARTKREAEAGILVGAPSAGACGPNQEPGQNYESPALTAELQGRRSRKA